MKVLVCGGRKFEDSKLMFGVLDVLHREFRFSLLIHGAAQGADRLAEMWAQRSRVPYRRFHAKWKTFGVAAGPIRNQRMLDMGQPELVIAFPGNTGTRDMIERALNADVPVMRVRLDGSVQRWVKRYDVETAI